jgi:hypothetical protein
VAWTVIHPELIPDNKVFVHKRIAGDTQWENASTLDQGIDRTALTGNATSDNSYEFYVGVADHCLIEQRESLIHNSILLSGSPDSVNDIINLKVECLYRMAEGVEKYEVWRKLDQDTVYKFIAYVSGIETNFSSRSLPTASSITILFARGRRRETMIAGRTQQIWKFEHPYHLSQMCSPPMVTDSINIFSYPRLNCIMMLS